MVACDAERDRRPRPVPSPSLLVVKKGTRFAQHILGHAWTAVDDRDANAVRFDLGRGPISPSGRNLYGIHKAN